ncbi:glycosyltransferase [Polaribacter undariae]|uniref:Glycosyltransferase n=1 Tax=Polaribacter sejongensis TaxID=985043 RepID=A0AAJ1VFJ6_9FLAO|nr:glycosyltransferase [Polaribacter undariae]MDN3618943.1 glycosyltransferase [Polaribacter undariae]UWD33032.1 glycosyltransferase [Polaribacter undariae]
MLAIVIPYYKIDFFKENLDSLSNQTDKRFKVYIGNDNSKDNPEKLLLKCDFEYTYKKFETNLGGISLVKQWERCLEMLEEEKWVMILGDDDVLGENVVEEFYKNITKVEEHNINVIRCATIKINETAEDISKLYKHPVIEKSTDFIFRKSRSSLSEYIFKKEKVDTIKFKDFPLAWYSDLLAVLEFSNFSNVFTINNSFVSVRVSDLSISGMKTNTDKKWKARFKYYYYLLHYKKIFFNVEQQKRLLKLYEKSYINNKYRVYYFIKISYTHFICFGMKYYLSFINSIIKSFKIQKN